MNKEPSNITLNDARLIFRNFAGKEGKYNRAGDRNFCVLIDEETAEILSNDGWNIKHLKPLNDEDRPQAYIPVAVNYEYRFPPKIYLKTSSGKTLLDEDTVGIIDCAEIAKVDLVIRPRVWETATGKGIKAYARTMIVEIVEDELEARFSMCEGHCNNCGGNCHCHDD